MPCYSRKAGLLWCKGVAQTSDRIPAKVMNAIANGYSKYDIPGF